MRRTLNEKNAGWGRFFLALLLAQFLALNNGLASVQISPKESSRQTPCLTLILSQFIPSYRNFSPCPISKSTSFLIHVHRALFASGFIAMREGLLTTRPFNRVSLSTLPKKSVFLIDALAQSTPFLVKRGVSSFLSEPKTTFAAAEKTSLCSTSARKILFGESCFLSFFSNLLVPWSSGGIPMASLEDFYTYRTSWLHRLMRRGTSRHDSDDWTDFSLREKNPGLQKQTGVFYFLSLPLRSVGGQQ
ncbi:MAG TPA: hypothetical protein PK876_11075 [Elusimicrobiota bacterium]|nr:hypothetical protein [Elusimicrobiota bacterium]